MKPSAKCEAFIKGYEKCRLDTRASATLHFVHQSLRDPEPRGDLALGEPFRPQREDKGHVLVSQFHLSVGISAPDASACRVLPRRVFGARYPLKIGRCVVAPVAVQMVNGRPRKIPRNESFSDQTVYVSALRNAGGFHLYRAISVIAKLWAKHSAFTQLRRLEVTLAGSQVVQGPDSPKAGNLYAALPSESGNPMLVHAHQYRGTPA